MTVDVFAKVFVAQILCASIIIFILKNILNKNLIELAVRRLETLPFSDLKDITAVIIISHKSLHKRYRDRVFKIATRYFGTKVAPVFEVDKKLWGGAIIKINHNVYDYSLKSRVHEAVQRR